MTRISCYMVAIAALAACGKPLETKEEFANALGNAAVPTSAAQASGAALSIYASNVDEPKQLPQPSISVTGTHGGEAILSVNPIGIVVGLAGQGILFDMEYKDYSVDGVNYLVGNVSVLANFDYIAAAQEDPNADFEVSFVGDLGLRGIVRDDTRVNLVVKTNLADLMTREGTTRLRLKGKVTASEHELQFEDEDLTIDWKALEQQAQQR